MSVQTAGELKRLLSGIRDDVPVIGHMVDHTFSPAYIVLGTALDEGCQSWGQDFGQESTPEPEFGKRVPVLIVE